MDWYVVEYLFPSAFKKFKEVMFPNVGVLSLVTLELYDNKKLYQFFDKQGIYLNIEMLNVHQWVFSISLKNGIVYGPTQDSRYTREESELDGFFDCFRILDKQIKEYL
jgi:hypothetical protein